MGQRNTKIRDAVRAVAPDLKKLASWIHGHPELGLQEYEACRRQVGWLRGRGFRVQTPFAGLKTAYKATRGKGRPVFCFMAEYDALPKLGHGCGHNLIAASALGAGFSLAETMAAERIPGTVVIMGTPAEEALGGKVRMVKAGALEGIDAVLMAHPSWRTTPDMGSTAVQRYTVTFHGKSAHAAASPELGRNALDAVLLLFQGINAWRQHLPENCRVHGIVTNGGAAANIIPDLASAFFYVRSACDETLAGMCGRFADLVKGAALMTGTTAETVATDVPYRARRPNRRLNEAYVGVAAELGLNPVIPDRPGRGSSDFGDVSQLRPAAHVYFGIARRQIAGHSTDLLKAAGSAYGLRQMLRAAEALAHAGHRFMAEKTFREDVIRAFGEEAS